MSGVVFGRTGFWMLAWPWQTLWFAGATGMRALAPQNDSTALMWAAHHVKVEALALLLDRGASLACKNKVSPSAAPAVCRSSDAVWAHITASSIAGRGWRVAWVAGAGARSGERLVEDVCGEDAGGGYHTAMDDVGVCCRCWYAC